MGDTCSTQFSTTTNAPLDFQAVSIYRLRHGSEHTRAFTHRITIVTHEFKTRSIHFSVDEIYLYHLLRVTYDDPTLLRRRRP